MRIDEGTVTTPGDVRNLSPGTVVILGDGVARRDDWTGIVSALAVAIARGANVVWERDSV